MYEAKMAAAKEKEINPIVVLERLKIDKFFVDSESKVVYLTKAGLKQVAAFFGFKLFTGVMGFKLHGWLYREAVQ